MQTSGSIRKSKQTSVVGYLPRKLTVDAKKKLDQKLLKLFVNDFQPFKVVEDSGFKQFVKALNPNYELPNRHAISKELIPALYEKCLVEMKSLTSTVESACLTTDCWTSRNNESFIAITIHFIDTEFELKSILLGRHSFNLNHTANNLAKEIERVLNSWNLYNKITFAVSDNAYNIKNALNMLGFKNMGCFAHTMNLIVQSALKLEEDLINKIKNIVSHFRKSTVANNALKTYQINNGIKEPKKLIQDVPTRWNSTYYMVCRFVELETSIRGTLGLINNAPENLKQEEWVILKDLIKILKPFEEATKAISRQKYMTASLVIVIVQGLFKVFNNLLKMNLTQRVLQVVEKLLANMNERDGFKHTEKSKTLSRCTFLDPRFKHIPPFNHNAKLLTTTKTDIIEKTSEIIRSKYIEDDGTHESATLVDVTHSNCEPLSIWNDIDSCVAKSSPMGTAKSRAIVEVQRYLEDPIITRCQDPLKW
ncbi:unnamed protein product [Macrosiphum euphorbiae]|uniref:Zinc finger BED domain-containing protein 4 n=1 Tax=Macrosiphum euphorbiae TaxID=13131 RepID=A0AAV0WJW8_9HEMI|nr:unnamed protein product [Macrosiphum euphorbiae]